MKENRQGCLSRSIKHVLKLGSSFKTCFSLSESLFDKLIIHASYNLDKGVADMQLNSTLILTAPPAHSRAALRFGLPVAHAAYRVGGGPHLFRANMPISVRGGLMALDCVGFDGRGEAGPFCQEVLRECSARGYDGILCDFEGRPMPLLTEIVRTLAGLTQKRGWPLYVTETYGGYADSAKVLISSALSGGSLAQRLAEAAQRYGQGRVALAIERVAEDFYLPSPSGQGQPLSQEELRRLMDERSPSIFFSTELCAHYFTYMSQENGAHFVLFDDAGSIRKKLQVARGLGIRQAVLSYPQIEDVLEDILAG